jgi:hypothetical protein
MDQLRARALMDIMLGRDSAARQPASAPASAHVPGNGSGPGIPPSPDGVGVPSAPSVIPAGFAGRINLTITLPTLLDLAERPGELGGIGPIDPALARDLAAAAATNPKTTWCVTVTDQQGHAIGHGCARPEPRNQRQRWQTRQIRRP